MKQRRSPALATILFALASCAGPAVFVRRPARPIRWPAGAGEPRIRFVFAYHGTTDVERRRGFFETLLSLFGTRREALVSPSGLAVSNAGGDDLLLIADPGRGAVHRVSFVSGRHDVFAGTAGTPLESPVGVAVVPDGRIYVTDSVTSRITVLGPDLGFRTSFGGEAELGRPTGIAYDPGRNRLLVCDTTGCRLLSYDLDGRQLAAAGKRGTAPGEFNYPTNVTVARDGSVVVVDSLNFRVQTLTPDLRPLRAFGIVGRGPGTFASPKGVALDPDGHVYVVDAMFDNVQIFDLQGRLLLAFGGRGTGLGQFYLPSGIVIDGRGRIIISDSGNARIQVLHYLGRDRE